MSSKAIMEKKEEPPPGGPWRMPAEVAPSAVGEEGPTLGRILGMIGLFLVMFASLILIITNFSGSRSVIANRIGPGWATFLGMIGLALMLLHAVTDKDREIRRAYMLFGYVWLGIGALASVWGLKTDAGSHFLPQGFTAILLGLLFLTAFLRNEAEARPRALALWVIGGIGAALALGGFLGGCISETFLVPDGFLVILLGLVFLWAYVGLKGTADDLAYRVGWAFGGVGLLVLLIALGRSAIPPLFAHFRWMNEPATDYLMPSGLVLMVAGLLYVMVSLALCCDHQLAVLTRREISSFFHTPTAYIVLIGFTLVAGMMFYDFVLDRDRGLWAEGEMGLPATPLRVLEPIVRGYLFSLYPIICVIITVPVLTMRMFSEEKRSGTIEMLLTTPVNETSMTLSKFLAALIFFMITFMPWGLVFVGLRFWGGKPFDYRPLLGFYVALLFSGAGFVSMGLFCSSVTKNQLTAAMLAFVGMLVFTFFYFLQRYVPQEDTRAIVYSSICYVNLWDNSLKGKLHLRDLLYHLSATIFWLFLTVKVLESRKWR